MSAAYDTVQHRLIIRKLVDMTIGVRANIHLGGQTEFCPNGFSGGGVVAEIFRDPYSVGGGGSSRNFPGTIFCGVAEFFPLAAVHTLNSVFFSR